MWAIRAHRASIAAVPCGPSAGPQDRQRGLEIGRERRLELDTLAAPGVLESQSPGGRRLIARAARRTGRTLAGAARGESRRKVARRERVAARPVDPDLVRLPVASPTSAGLARTPLAPGQLACRFRHGS
jgi:hypothetical protein